MRLVVWLEVLVVLLAVALSPAAEARAQDGGQADSEGLDEEARALFTAGSTAFGNARFEDALDYFRRAYELSHRPALLYNIGIAADRLRHDREALEAFEQFLEEVPEHPRRRDVEARVQVLRRAVASEQSRSGGAEEEDDAAAPAPDVGGAGGVTAGATTGPQGGSAPPPGPSDSGGGPSLVGPIVLGVVGVAGVTAAVVGLVSSDDCLTDVGGTCVEERRPSALAVGVYGGVGLAAIAGAVLWLVLGGGSDDEGGDGSPAVALSGNGLDLGWTF